MAKIDTGTEDLLADLDETIDPNAVFPWFHRNLSKTEAVNLLVRAGRLSDLHPFQADPDPGFEMGSGSQGLIFSKKFCFYVNI